MLGFVENMVGCKMIISIKDLINICHDNFGIDTNDIMVDYHLRFEDKRASMPINHIEIDKQNRAIVLGFKQENIWKGIDGDDGE